MKSAEKIQVFYEIAMSIEEDRNIYEMLQKALITYLKKLHCNSALVFKAKHVNENSYINDLFFSLPFTANIKEDYKDIEYIMPHHFDERSYLEFHKKLPINGQLTNGQYYHTFPLPNFGFLILVRDSEPFENEILYSLHEINNKLSLSCIACLNTDALIASEKKYKELTELLPEMICEVNNEGFITYANTYAYKKTGYTDEDIKTGMHILSLFHEEERVRVMNNFASALLSDEKKPNEYKALTKDGKILSVLVYSSRILEKNKPIGIRGVMIDISDRKANELKLKQYAERLELALIGSDAVLWDWNISTGSIYFSDRWYSMLGYSTQEIEPNIMSWSKLVHPDDLNIVREAIKKHLNGETNLYRSEHRMKTKDGNWKWILGTGKVTEKNEQGQAIRVVGTHIDITERELANKKLLEQSLQLEKGLVQQTILSEIALELNSLESFSKRMQLVLQKIGKHTGVSRTYIFENSTDGLTTSNTFEWCNNGIENQIDELQDIPYEILPSWKEILFTNGRVYSENIQELPEDLREILEPQEIKSIIVYPLYVQGHFFGFIGFDECVRYKKWTNSELELLRTISGIIANTYERKISENSLKESESKNRAILESIPDILFHFNNQGVILSFRSSSKEQLALDPENFINRPISEIFPGEFSEQVLSAIDQCLQKGYFMFEYSMNIHGTEANFEARMSRMNDNEVIAIVRNVSERKEYEQKLKEERDRANEANKIKSEFLANMSHEIRTPMNAVIGFSESLYNQLENSQHKKMVKTIISSGNLLLSLLNDILDLSKIEAGKLELNYQSVNLSSIYNEIKLLFDDKAKSKAIQISIFQNSNFPDFLLLDEIRIKQVLFNLVGNAVKFTHNGYVNICSEFHEKNENKGVLIIKIEDSGIGIPEEQQNDIFQSFKQQSGQSTRIYGGAGLGLAIAKRLIESMEGTISLKSEINKGSTFTITLPNVDKIVSVEKKSTEYELPIDNIVFKETAILVVDDVFINTETIKSLLSDTAIIVNTAKNGKNALDYLMHNMPAIILLDLRMPIMDGYELAEKIKKNEQLNKIPIIAYTANATDKEELSNSPLFDDVLLKPTNRIQLIEKLMKYLDFEKENSANSKLNFKGSNSYVLDEAVKKELPRIIKLLETKYLTQWEKINDSLVLFNIEEFALQLIKEYENIGLAIFVDYANQLLEDIDLVDLESLEINLKKFPILLDELKKGIELQQ